MRTPHAYEKLTKEIDDASASGQLSQPLVRYNEASKLPYLDACCKEAMRLHPSVALTIPRNVPAGGYEINVQFFPTGTRVGVNAAVIHRDPRIFGQDADDFVPERWLLGDTTNMDRHMFQFGGGSRTCIGKNVRLLSLFLCGISSPLVAVTTNILPQDFALRDVQGRTTNSPYLQPFSFR